TVWAVAVLWAGWKDEDAGEVAPSFTIVTAGANDMMAPIHDRMPVMIPEDAWERWLDPSRTAGARLAALESPLAPDGGGWLEISPVSRRVNDVRNDGPDLVEPIPPSDVAA